MNYREINFDGLVGPTHNYAGLSFGNVASKSNKATVSSPRKAALQGLAKAKALADRGFPQAVLPPHERPSIHDLKAWGFSGGTDAAVLAQVAKEAPLLLSTVASASAMWTANACTMAPSCDTEDARVHFTPANLHGNLHRSLEAPFTQRLLQTIFADSRYFTVHSPLAGGDAMADEGAANHTRLYARPGHNGLHLFVFGRSTLDLSRPSPERFPARQTLESIQAISRLHQIKSGQALFLQQSPEAIDAGVFHNDVISVGHADTFLYHEAAFVDTPAAAQRISAAFTEITGQALRLVPVKEAQVSLQVAVQTYLFNSQLLGAEGQPLTLVTPAECRENTAVSGLLDQWLEDPDNPVGEVLSFDLRESMRNGGGPACLRQRITLSDEEVGAIHGRLLLNDSLYGELSEWISRNYRSELHPRDLADPRLLDESRKALDELTHILQLPSVYPFQTGN